MGSGETLTITMTGGAPWGFRLQGGGVLPLQVSKIRKKSKAHALGLREGDAILYVNGVPVAGKSHDQAMELVDDSLSTLTIKVFRGNLADLPSVAPAPEATVNGQDVDSSNLDTEDSTTATFSLGDFEITSEVTVESAEEINGGDVGESLTLTTDTNVEETGGLLVQAETSVQESQDAGQLQADAIIVEATNVTQPEPSNGDVADEAATVSLENGGLQVQTDVRVESGSGVEKITETRVEKDAGVETRAETQVEKGEGVRRRRSRETRVEKGDGVQKTTVVQSEQSIISSSQPGFALTQATDISRSPRSLSPRALSPMQQQQPRPVSPKQPPPVLPKTTRPFSPMQPSSVQPVQAPPMAPQQPQVRVSAMYSSSQEDRKENIAPRVPSDKIPTFHVRDNISKQNNSTTSTVNNQQTWNPDVWLQNKEQQRAVAQQQQEQQWRAEMSRHQYQQRLHEQELARKQQMEEARQQQLYQARLKQQQQLAKQRKPTPGIWQPNVWMPGTEPTTSIVDIQKRKFMSQTSEMDDDEEMMSPVQGSRPNHLPVFAPPVEIKLADGSDAVEYNAANVSAKPGLRSLEMVRMDSLESDSSSPTSSLRKKKMFADSAFYDDPVNKYPTINEQMKLCQKIAHSLTAQANKNARGARMFAKRKRKSNKWIHEGHPAYSEYSSSQGDVADLGDLDSELYLTEGGTRPLFSFRIPNLKHRVSSPESPTRMSLTAAEFEKLRLGESKCDHRNVAPNTCFDIAQALKSNKGRAGKLFEKRRARSEKYVIDETNAKKAPEKTRLDMMTGSVPKPFKSPWQAACENQGNVDAAFDHLPHYEQMQKLNDRFHAMKRHQTPMKPTPPPVSEPVPLVIPRQTNLAADHQMSLLQGPKFNRVAKGWNAGATAELPMYSSVSASASPRIQSPAPEAFQPSPQNRGSMQSRDFNPKPKAWRGGFGDDGSLYSPSDYTSESQWSSPGRGYSSPGGYADDSYTNSWGYATPPGGYRPGPNFSGGPGLYNTFPRAHHHHAMAAMPGSDL